jgi:regulator of protease activity HflC (stomatin/prohibitin superfamily)
VVGGFPVADARCVGLSWSFPVFPIRLHVKRHERGLVFVRGDFRAVLGPGTYVRWPLIDALRGRHVEVVSRLAVRFEHPLLDVLVKEPELQAELFVHDVSDTQRVLFWQDGRFGGVLGPGRHAYWKGPAALAFETLDVGADGVLTHAMLGTMLESAQARRWLRVVEATPGHETIVFRDARPSARLTTGRLVLWLDQRPTQVVEVDLREQSADVAGQEIMTQDKVTLRVNLVVTWQVVDALTSVTATTALDKALYREAQLALRAAVGGRTLEALLADKDSVGQELRRVLGERAQAYGAVVRSVGLKDIVLPGEMKTILNQVIEAQKEAEAHLIKRREETAAARSQANTARLLAENPMLLRLKELETMQEILAGARTTFVLGREPLALQMRALLDGDPPVPPAPSG